MQTTEVGVGMVADFDVEPSEVFEDSVELVAASSFPQEPDTGESHLHWSHCPSLPTALHFPLPLTTHCPSLHAAPHFTLPLTTCCPSLHTALHFMLLLTSRCLFPLTLTSHCPSLHAAPHYTLPLTSHCLTLHSQIKFTFCRVLCSVHCH